MESKHTQRDLDIYYLHKQGDTYQEIGERYDISGTRVRQIVARLAERERTLNKSPLLVK